MRRLGEDRKADAVIRVLYAHHHDMTQTEVGKVIGYQSGRPVKHTLGMLERGGYVRSWSATLNTGTVATYWRLTGHGREHAEYLLEVTQE